MALCRCLKVHAWPKGRTQQYVGYVLPVGYPVSSLVCGLCDEPGAIWLDSAEASAYEGGTRIFDGPNAFARMKANDGAVNRANESRVETHKQDSAIAPFEKNFKQAIEQFHRDLRFDQAKQRYRDPFIDWYKQEFQQQATGAHDLRTFVILVNARFDQGARAERALENTRAVYGAGILRERECQLSLLPELKTRRLVSTEKWRRLFQESLPKLFDLSREIGKRPHWKASELLHAIQSTRIPYFGPKTARLAVRWIHELIPEVTVDMSDSRVPVDSLLYRLAARLGIIDPNRQPYTGQGSPGDEAIQQFAKMLFPHDPTSIDEPLWMMGRNKRDGGHCYPVRPDCDSGCIFSPSCPRNYLGEDPVKDGYLTGDRKATPRDRPQTNLVAQGMTDTGSTATANSAVRTKGMLVVVACVSKKIWDKDLGAPERVRAKDAYVSPYFRKNRAYAECFGESWGVMSAKYGLLGPDEEIEEYDTTFRLGRPDLVSISTLKCQIEEKQLYRFKLIQILGGREYASRLHEAMSSYQCVVEAPLSGLRIGQSMHRVDKALSSAQILKEG